MVEIEVEVETGESRPTHKQRDLKMNGPSKFSLGFFFVLGFCSVLGAEHKDGIKVDMPDTPVVSNSPPEGNTTFIGGTTWCVASPQASQEDLQDALDWACGPGLADCSAIQTGQPCYQENNLLAIASYAFNAYYQANGDSPIACNFGGTGTITYSDPSYGSCQFLTSGNSNDGSSSPSLPNPGICTWLLPVMLVLVHLKITIDKTGDCFHLPHLPEPW